MPTYKNIYYADGATPMVSSQISYDEMSSAGDAIEAVERNIPIKVKSSIERDAKYPVPNDGDAVWRTDIGVEQRYSATTPIGWYSATTGLMSVKPTSVVFGGTGSGSVSESGLITFNAVSNIYVNGIFGPAFKNYKILFNLQSQTVATDLYFRWAVDDVEDGSNNYHRTNFYANSATLSGSYGVSTVGIIKWIGANNRAGLTEMTLYNPYLGKPVVTSISASAGQGVAGGYFQENFYFNSATASFDGFRIFPSTASNLTGSMLIYGFN